MFNGSTPIIPSKVTEVAWDDRFVVAAQDALAKKGSYSPGTRRYVAPVFRTQYWVLDVSGPLLHGPYTETEFTARRRELGVPEDLVLKPVRSHVKRDAGRDRQR